MRNWKFRKCKMEQQRQLPAFPPAGKSCKPISSNYTWKTARCLNFQVTHAVKESIDWEAPRYTTCLPLCSNSQRAHQPPGAHGREACGVMGWWPQEDQETSCWAVRRAAASFGGPKKSAGLFRAFQSAHKLYDPTWSQVFCPLYDTEGNVMNLHLLKYAATDIKYLLSDYWYTPMWDYVVIQDHSFMKKSISNLF